MKTERQNVLKDKSFALAVRIVKLCDYLKKTKKESTLSRQLMRSGTNSGAMVREAQNAESDADFVHKLGVAQKETDETMYWIELMRACDFLSEAEFQSIHNDAEEVFRLLRSIILTKKSNMIKTKIMSGLLLIAGAISLAAIIHNS